MFGIFLFILLLAIGIPAYVGYRLGYRVSSKKYPSGNRRVLIGVLCAVGCVLVVVAVAFGACAYMLSNTDFR